MSATDILYELPQLTQVERRLILERLQQLALKDEEVHLHEPTATYGTVDLCSRGIEQSQARDLLARLRTFAEDWDRREDSIYDENPAR